MSSNQIETIHNIIANYQSVNYQKINVYGIVTYIGSKSSIPKKKRFLFIFLSILFIFKLDVPI